MHVTQAATDSSSEEDKVVKELLRHQEYFRIVNQLAVKQKMLREAFSKKFEEEKKLNPRLVITQVADKLQANRRDIENFKAGFQSLGGRGKTLGAVATYCGQQALAKEISELTSRLPSDRWIGLATLSPSALSVMELVWEQWIKLGKLIGMESFSSLFSPHAELIRKLLMQSFDEDLDRAQIQEEILTTLGTNFAQRVEEVAQAQYEALTQKRDEWNRKREALKAKFPEEYAFVHQVAKLVGLAATTLNCMNTGKGGVSIETYDRAIGRIDQLLAEPPTPPVSKQATPSKKQQVSSNERSAQSTTQPATPPASATATLPSRKDARASEMPAPAPAPTSTVMKKDGVPAPDKPYSPLTPENFQAFDLTSPEEFIAFVRLRLQLATACLNALVQIRDPEVLERAKIALKGEVQELFIALKLATERGQLSPELLAMWDEQRRDWAGQKSSSR